MGAMEVPAEALYGASTQRAVLNFPVSGYRFGREFIRALGLVKWAAVEANLELDKIDDHRGSLIAQATEEMVAGKLDEHFPVDIYQTGSGTSTNMNANEVIANRCAQIVGKPIGSKDPVHPNDHVNMGQSSNDVIPTAIHIAVAEQPAQSPHARAGRPQRCAGMQGGRVLGGDQDWPHPPHGCDARAAGSGILRLRQTGGVLAAARRQRHLSPGGAPARGHSGWDWS